MSERLTMYGPWFVNAENGRCCKHCNVAYFDNEDADEYGTGLCADCFEAGLEDYEERRRERIARENEY